MIPTSYYLSKSVEKQTSYNHSSKQRSVKKSNFFSLNPIFSIYIIYIIDVGRLQHKTIVKTAKRFFTKHRHEMASNFWGPEVVHFGPPDGPLRIDLEVPFFRLKLGRTSTLTSIRSADSDLQIYFQKFCVTNHCALSCGSSDSLACTPIYELFTLILKCLFERYDIKFHKQSGHICLSLYIRPSCQTLSNAWLISRKTAVLYSPSSSAALATRYTRLHYSIVE